MADPGENLNGHTYFLESLTRVQHRGNGGNQLPEISPIPCCPDADEGTEFVRARPQLRPAVVKRQKISNQCIAFFTSDVKIDPQMGKESNGD
jgi:hypothetical protein